MRCSFVSVTLLVLLLGMAAPALVEAASAADAEEGFAPIFNGKDLTGWEGEPGYWSVEDGAITGKTTTDKRLAHATYLFWRGGKPANFELRATYRFEGSFGNSGINFRSRELPKWDVKGYQADMEVGPSYTGILYECNQREIMTQRGQKLVIAEDGRREVATLAPAAELQKLIKPNGWNQCAIIARGPEIILKINGVVTSHVIDRQKGKAAADGLITLQLHPGPPMKVQFKDIRIKRLVPLARAAEPQLKVVEGKESLCVANGHWDVEVSLTRPQFLHLAVDSLGLGQFQPSALSPPPAAPQPTTAQRSGAKLEYRRQGLLSSVPARWTFEFGATGIVLVSRWSQEDPPEPVVLDFASHLCHATLLGRINPDGGICLPALMHLPDQGSFRITATGTEQAVLGYDARRAVGPYVKVTFPPATRTTPRLEYRWEATAIYPRLAGIESDPRFNGFRRNWLNILQINPRLRVLANHSASDTCAFCYYEYADIARHTPPLAKGLIALDMVRQSLERILGGMLAYGMSDYLMFDNEATGVKHREYPTPSLDTYPSLLIAAHAYVRGNHDNVWLERHYAGIKQWAEQLLATDRDGNGLFEYSMSGNSGSWPPRVETRPANWWDTIGFGHEDAYANALAYRALRGMEEMARQLAKPDDALRYQSAADKLQAAYYDAFYNPATGVLAGWRSADGQLHDYYFLFVNGIAIHYGLVSKDQANAIMDKLLAKMKEVGYTRFDLGLPGNLIPVARKDYVHMERRWGGGQKEDNSDGFQIYENGGATACFAYFTLAALYDLGRREEADRILFPMLESFEKGSFRGRGANGMTNDWKAWDGTPWGYEGFLVDNYYALLAVLSREGCLEEGKK